MRKFVLYSLLLLVALAPISIGAISGAVTAKPMIGYYMFQEPDKQTQMANVEYYTDYTLEDNTYIGSDYTGWGGPAGGGSSLISTIAMNVAAGVGGGAGWNFGSWAGNWAAAVLGQNVNYATYYMGLGAMAAGPWVGLAVGAALGTL